VELCFSRVREHAVERKPPPEGLDRLPKAPITRLVSVGCTTTSVAITTGHMFDQVAPASVDLNIPSDVAAQTVRRFSGLSFIACMPVCWL
jgi:hypothetical protein